MDKVSRWERRIKQHVLDLFLLNEETFLDFMCMHYEQFIELTGMIAPIAFKTEQL